MNPIKGYTMSNFLHWLVVTHPDIGKLEGIPMERLLELVDEFEHGKLRHNDELRHKWEGGFHFLFKERGDWQGYEKARQELKSLENRNHIEHQGYRKKNPVHVYMMIEFLRWLQSIHPEIRQLEKLPMDMLLGLVGEFKEMTLRRDHTLIEEWESGFQLLFNGGWGDEYGEARRELRYFEDRSAR